MSHHISGRRPLGSTGERSHTHTHSRKQEQSARSRTQAHNLPEEAHDAAAPEEQHELEVLPDRAKEPHQRQTHDQHVEPAAAAVAAVANAAAAL